ncbi:MAG: thioredoxin family protein [Bacteroidales bacterium]|nr:thioredoxin family protein [Bacteroidales bacterium]
MRNHIYIIFSIIFTTVLALSCKQEAAKYSYFIEGQLSATNNDWVIVQKLLPTGAISVDSVQPDERGDFSLEMETADSNELFVLFVKKYPWRITLAMQADETAKIEADAQYLHQTYSVSGSSWSKQLRKLAHSIESFSNSADSIYFLFRNSSSDSLQHLSDSLLIQNQKDVHQFVRQFCSENQYNLAGLVGLYSRYNNRLVLDYAADFDLFETVWKSNSRAIGENLHVQSLGEFVEERRQIELVRQETEDNIALGKKLPTMMLPIQDGKIINTDSIGGKPLILAFWNSTNKDSWKLNEALKELRNTHNNNKLAIISVSTDNDKIQWNNTIKLDKLDWTHGLCDQNYYRIFNLETHIPRVFVVDHHGVIVSKDPNPDSLTTIVTRLIAKP